MLAESGLLMRQVLCGALEIELGEAGRRMFVQKLLADVAGRLVARQTERERRHLEGNERSAAAGKEASVAMLLHAKMGVTKQ